MKYLLALVRQERPSVTGVAHIFGVNKSTVSRALTTCAERGLLDTDYQLTKYGRHYVSSYQKQYEQIYKWLSKRGISEESAREDTFSILESCSNETKQMLGQSGEFCRACEHFKAKGRRVTINGSNLWQYVSEGAYEVPFVFHRDKRKGLEQVSMANEAFHHPLKMIVKKNNSKLCLRLRRMKQDSLIERIKLEGKLKEMSYEVDGYIREIHIDDDTAHIPLSALNFIYIEEDHILQGYVKLTMTCTVGTIHMPKSPALLTVYL